MEGNNGDPKESNESNDNTTIIVICVLIPLIIIGLIIIAMALTWRKKQKELSESSPLKSQPAQPTSNPATEHTYLDLIGPTTLPGENIYDTPNNPPSEMGDEPDYRKVQRELKERNEGTLYPQVGEGNSGSSSLPDPENEYRDIQQELEGINRGKLYPRVSNMK